MTGKAILLNKQIWLAVGMVTFIGAVVATGTGAFFSDTADVTGNTFAAGTLDLQLTKNEGGGSPADTKSALWNFTNMAPGGTPESSSVWLRNVGSIDGATLGVAASFSNNGLTPSQVATAQQLRITEMTLDGNNLLEGGAGASIREYETPTNCTTTVTPGGFVAAVTGATAGDVLCVDAGTYTPGTVAISAANVTIVGLNDPQSAAKASVVGTFDVNADGITIKGLEMTNPDDRSVVIAAGVNDLAVTDNVVVNVGTNDAVVVTGGVQAVYIQGTTATALSGFEVAHNRFTNIGNTTLNSTGPNGSSAKAIYVGDTGTGAGIDDVKVNNNIITTVRASDATFGAGGRGAYGFLTNHQSVTNLVVENNTISDLSGWWEQGVSLYNDTLSAIVRLNNMSDFDGVTGAGVNVESNPSAATLVIEDNNFAVSVSRGVENQTAATVSASNNWWGGFTATAIGNVDATPIAGGPFGGLIGGTDANGNGYADLDDLRLTAVTGITPGLDSYTGSNDQEFVLAVQLDGPTTGNDFQEAVLDDYEIEFSLNQI